MNNTKLLLEGWRSYINEIEMQEGVASKAYQFLKNKLLAAANEFKSKLQEAAADADPINPADLQKIPEFAELSNDIASLKSDMEDSESQIKEGLEAIFANPETIKLFKNILTEEIDKLSDEDDIEEGGIIGLGLLSIGSILALIGGGILFFRTVKWVINKAISFGVLKPGSLDGTISLCDRIINKLHSIEQKIKNLISKLKVFDAAGYYITTLALKYARAKPDGKIGSYFRKKGITLLMDKNYPIPPLKAFLDPKFRPDPHAHVTHESKISNYKFVLKEAAPQQYNVNLVAGGADTFSNYNAGATGSRKDRRTAWKQTQKQGGDEREQLAKEIKTLVSMNQSIAYMLVLGLFIAYGAFQIWNNGITTVVTKIEAATSTVKSLEIGAGTLQRLGAGAAAARNIDNS